MVPLPGLSSSLHWNEHGTNSHPLNLKQFPAKPASIKSLKTYCWTNWIQTLNATDYYVLYVISQIDITLSFLFYVYISL
jgi:hypothetical protein